jgi:hypothetical protein
LITCHFDEGSKTIINSFGVVSAQSGNFFEKSKQLIQHVNAKAEDLKIKIDLWILPHLFLTGEFPKLVSNRIPAVINHSNTLILFVREDKFPKKVLIGDEYIMIDPLVFSLEIQYD